MMQEHNIFTSISPRRCKMDLVYIVIIVLLLWSVFVLQLSHIAAGSSRTYMEYTGAFVGFMLAVGIICWFAVGFAQTAEVATATICITLLWVIYVFQFTPKFIQAFSKNTSNVQIILAMLPILFTIAGLIYWYVFEMHNYNEFSTSNAILHIIFAQYFFLFPTRFARTLYCLYKQEECKDDEDFFLRLFYYSTLWFIFSLLGDLTLFLVINVVNVLFQFSDIMVKVLLTLRKTNARGQRTTENVRPGKISLSKSSLFEHSVFA